MPLKIYDRLSVGPLACNCYILGDPDTLVAIVVDPGDDAGVILSVLEEHRLSLSLTVATHAHFDHVLAAGALRQATGAPFYLHNDDEDLLSWVPASLELFLGRPGGEAPVADQLLRDGEELSTGGLSLTVVHTPGHSPGSISLIGGRGDGTVLFSGDTLFAGSIGRTDLPGGDGHQLIKSVRQRLFPLGDLPVHPGHGAPTTLDRERISNPFVGEGARFWSS
ncbi:MAG: MBL fold metallo-hydrolase [Actinomycetota bacterium]